MLLIFPLTFPFFALSCLFYFFSFIFGFSKPRLLLLYFVFPLHRTFLTCFYFLSRPLKCLLAYFLLLAIFFHLAFYLFYLLFLFLMSMRWLWIYMRAPNISENKQMQIMSENYHGCSIILTFLTKEFFCFAMYRYHASKMRWWNFQCSSRFFVIWDWLVKWCCISISI